MIILWLSIGLTLGFIALVMCLGVASKRREEAEGRALAERLVKLGKREELWNRALSAKAGK